MHGNKRNIGKRHGCFNMAVRRHGGNDAKKVSRTKHSPAFFICETCNAVAEAPGAEVAAAMGRAADGIGFRIRRMNVEAVGLCPACGGAA